MKILQDLQTVALPTQLCGIMPFFSGKQPENFRISSRGKLYGRVVAVILLVSSVVFCEDVLFASQHYRLMTHSQGDTEDINRTIETLFCIISYTVIVTSSVLNASKQYRTIRDLSKLDSYMEAHGYKATYSCRYLGTLLVFVSASVFFVAFYYINFLSEIAVGRECVLLCIYGLQMLYSCMFALYLRTILKILALRIEFLNGRLEEFTQKDKHQYDKEDWCELSNLIEILCKFRYITENMNSVTGVALLFFFGFSFYTVTNQSYLAFSTLTTPDHLRKEHDTIILSCAWVIAETVIIAVICSSFDCLASELAMTPNTWVVDMASHRSRLYPNSYPTRRVTPGNDAFLRRAIALPVAPSAPPENPVFEDINTIISVLKATGLLPIYEQLSSFEVGPPTKTNEFYSFFVRGVVHALTIFNIYSLMTPNSAKLFISLRETDNVNQWIELLLCIFTYTLMVLVCARNTKSILQIMNEILKLDHEVLRLFGVALSNNCNFSVKFLVLITVCQAYIIFLRIYALSGISSATTYILIGFYAIQNGLTATYIVFASALLRIVCIRFQFVNQLLNGYTYVRLLGKTPRQLQIHMKKFPEDSLYIYRTHNRLLRIYKNINESCSLIIVCFLGYSFYTVTTNWYNLFVQITNNKGVISSHIMQWCLAWLCLHTSLLTLLSRSCGATTYEANTTSQILSRVYGKSKEFQNIIDKFLTKSIKQEVQFTAYGFFAIDNSTLFKIFSAVTTYLVILIQFKQLEDSKMEEQT